MILCKVIIFIRITANYYYPKTERDLLIFLQSRVKNTWDGQRWNRQPLTLDPCLVPLTTRPCQPYVWQWSNKNLVKHGYWFLHDCRKYIQSCKNCLTPQVPQKQPPHTFHTPCHTLKECLNPFWHCRTPFHAPGNAYLCRLSLKAHMRDAYDVA